MTEPAEPASASAGWSVLLKARLESLAHEWSQMTAHPVLVGSAREKALATLIRDLIPRRYEVLDGTIALVDENDAPVKVDDQLDLMIVDTWRYPTLLRAGATAVVLPEAVRAVIEVKSTLTSPLAARPKSRGEEDEDSRRGRLAAKVASKKSTSFLSALRQLGAVMQHKSPEHVGPIPRVLFAYSGLKDAASLASWLDDVVEVRKSPTKLQGQAQDAQLLAAAALPDLIAVLNGGLCAERKGGVFHVHQLDPAQALAVVLQKVLNRVTVEADDVVPPGPAQATPSASRNEPEAPLLAMDEDDPGGEAPDEGPLEDREDGQPPKPAAPTRGLEASSHGEDGDLTGGYLYVPQLRVMGTLTAFLGAPDLDSRTAEASSNVSDQPEVS